MCVAVIIMAGIRAIPVLDVRTELVWIGSVITYVSRKAVYQYHDTTDNLSFFFLANQRV